METPEVTVIEPEKKLKKLTMKQRIFVKELMNNKHNGLQAALVAYDTKDKNTAGAIASENLTKPNVREAIETALSKKGLSLEQIADNLKLLAVREPEKVNADTMLKANVEILKLYGAYPGTKHVHLGLNINTKVKEMDFTEAKNALAELRGSTDHLLKDTE